VKWELERRFPARYTASNSPRRTNRASRGNFIGPVLLGCKPMTSLLAACRQYFASALGLHAYPEAMGLGAPPLARLIGPLWQNNPPYLLRRASLNNFIRPRRLLFIQPHRAVPPQPSRSSNRFRILKCSRRRAPGQENAEMAYRAENSDTRIHSHQTIAIPPVRLARCIQ
jgi:hypothetical protein